MSEIKINLEEIFHKMGYRYMKDNLFGKPIAYSIFTIEIQGDCIIWKNRFKNNDEIFTWSSKKISTNDFNIEFLKDCENESSVSYHGYESSFEFGF